MIGQKLNKRYTITARLGKGAMGTVYRAIDAQAGQDVALKVISNDLTIDPQILERFKREGESLHQLKHPNIVGFSEAFQYDEQYVLVMEYVPGGNLHDLIKQGPLPVERARKIALELCDALVRSHHLNIIHRDIKPENVLLAKDGTPKLADFGVARLNEGTRMTRSGTQVGTPYYMAPEAWEGKNLDAQADIWSLGVVLFEMLTGQVPFGGDTGATVMNKVLTTRPPDLKKLRGDIPSNLVNIIKRMLHRDKKQRYTTMRQLAADLEQDQLGISGKTIMSGPRSNKLSRTLIITILGAIIMTGLATKIFNSKNLAITTTATSTPLTTQKSPEGTSASESTSQIQTIIPSTESIISMPVAIVNEQGANFYDQFEEESYEGDFNRSLWIADLSNCTVKQINGVIQFVNNPAGSHQVCDLDAGKPTTLLPPSQLGVFEVQAMISSDYNRKAVTTKEIQFKTESLPGGTWFAICGLIVNGTDEVEGFMSMSFYGDTGYTDYSGTTSLKTGFDTWHTVHLTMDPKSLAVSCLVDDQLVGSVIPRNTELLASAQFSRVIEAARGSGAFATSYVDNVYFEPPSVLSWEFNTEGDPEDWGLTGGADVTATTVSKGVLSFKATGNDPQLYTRDGLSINAGEVKTMWIRMRISNGTGPAELFFNTLELGDWASDRARQFVVQTGNEFRTYIINLGSYSSWRGTISQLRLDPISDYVGAVIEIDYIRLFQ